MLVGEQITTNELYKFAKKGNLVYIDGKHILYTNIKKLGVLLFNIKEIEELNAVSQKINVTLNSVQNKLFQ